MSGTRTGVPNPPTIKPADDRVPFPHTDQTLGCRTNPALFEIDAIPASDSRAREKALANAARVCSGCPIVQGCLKWALANPKLTKNGVWAATTSRDRTKLRKKLVDRLGEDWVAVVAEQDRRREQRAARIVPPTVREQALARLELELIPARPAPYEPWREPMTPSRQEENRRLLLAAIKDAA
ncbi:WhiB family transcriptional regulator (plasmid) [Streptomyces sp. QH1-20]|uniref:WhiB family transcriptional regulator n=1 Tax=Streptomyces sp. QH1-20 TaxID=3240934 RepID=UPI0035121F6C